MSATRVNVENFVRAESDRMFASFVTEAGGVNVFKHRREPTAVEDQPVIRMNRDTLYSAAIVDISRGATLTIPDSGQRYVSVMVVNQDHYINQVFHQPGQYRLTLESFDTPWVAVAARVLVDPSDVDDVSTVNRLQDGFAVEAPSATAFDCPEYDTESLNDTRAALLTLAKGLTPSTERSAQRRKSTLSATCWAQPRAGADFPSGRPATSASSQTFRWARLADRPRCPRRRLLVGVGLQRRRLLRAKPARGVQRQQPHRRSQRRRLSDDSFRR